MLIGGHVVEVRKAFFVAIATAKPSLSRSPQQATCVQLSAAVLLCNAERKKSLFLSW